MMNKHERWIAMIVPTVDNSFFSSLVTHVEREMRSRGIRTLVVNSANSADNEIEYLKMLAALSPDGLISVSGLAALPAGLVSDDLPIVWIDRIPRTSKQIPWVSNDDDDAMEMAVTYLIQKGCQNILLLPGYVAQDQNNPRVSGYRRALEKNGIPFNENYVLNRKGIRSSEEETGELVTKAIRDGYAVDAIVTSSDRAAFGAANALQEDIRLISFDNSPYAALTSPMLTTLDRKPEVLARKACEILFDLMEGREEESVENVVEVSLVERGSTR